MELIFIMIERVEVFEVFVCVFRGVVGVVLDGV